MSASTRYNWRFEVEAKKESRRYYDDDVYFTGTSDEAEVEANRCEEDFIENTDLEIVRVNLERCGEAKP